MDILRTFQSDVEYLTLVRVRIAQGRYEEAIRLLEPLLQTVNEQKPERRIRTIIETLVLLALVLQAQNKTEQAITTFFHLLRKLLLSLEDRSPPNLNLTSQV